MARGLRPIRYTRAAASEAGSGYKSVTDNSPGVRFKDATGGIHTVPDKNRNRTGSKARGGMAAYRVRVRDL